MKIEDFQVGAIFTYTKNPEDDITIGLGEVIEVGRCIYDTELFGAKIQWKWCPTNEHYTREDWYDTDLIARWVRFCTIIPEQERLVLLLKYNFG